MAIQIEVRPDVFGFADAVRLAMVRACLSQAMGLLDKDSMAWSLVDRAVATLDKYEKGKR